MNSFPLVVSVAIGFGMIVAAMVVSRILRQGRKKATAPSGRSAAELRYGRGVWATGFVLGVLMPAFFSAVAFRRAPSEADELWYFVGMIVLFGALGWWMLLECFSTRVAVDHRGLTARSFLVRPRYVAWSDIVEVRLAKRMGYLVLTARTGVTVRLSLLLSGFGDLVHLLRERVDKALCAEALDELSDYYKRHRA